MKILFNLTVKALLAVAANFRLTYHEINILVWYFFLPLIWALILSFKLHAPWLFVGACVLALILGRGFRKYSDRLFMLSARFLLMFRHVGMDYVVASVVICLVVPVVITVALLCL